MATTTTHPNAALAQLATYRCLSNLKTLRRYVREALGLPADADVEDEVGEVLRIREIQVARAAARLGIPNGESHIMLLQYRAEKLREERRAARVAKMKRRVTARLRGWGFQRERSAGGSSYYWHPEADITVRVSDHDVPMTDRREDMLMGGGRSWANSTLSVNLADSTEITIARWLVSIRRRVAKATTAA